jgi:hypothetical protein
VLENTEKYTLCTYSALVLSFGLLSNNFFFSDVPCVSLGLKVILVLVTRITQVTITRIRFLSTLNLNKDQQRYWTLDGSFWSKTKKNLLIPSVLPEIHQGILVINRRQR